MALWRGGLFSEYFLDEGVRELPGYAAIGEADIAELERALVGRFDGLLAMHRPGEAVTERDLIDHVLNALGWRDRFLVQTPVQRARTDVPDYLLFADAPAKAAAAALPNPRDRYKRGVAIVEAKAWDVPLDRGGGALGEGVPSSQMLRYLNNVEVASDRAVRFGVLTNGRLWRLYDQQAPSKANDYLQLDLLALLGGVLANKEPDLLDADERQRGHGLKLLLLFFGRAAFVADADGRTPLRVALGESKSFEAQVTEKLAQTVFDRVFAGLASALAEGDPLRSPSVGYLAELRDATLTYLYRLLFVLYAEDRLLLPTRDPAYEDYSLDRIRRDIADRTDAADAFIAGRTSYDDNLRGLWAQIDRGDPSVGVPPYNGKLFAADRVPLLNRVRVPDARLAPLLDAMSRDAAGRRINYRDLSVRQLGSVYERLLDFDLVEKDEGEKDGHEGHLALRLNPYARKNSGSYYTPEELVALILRRTLRPLLDERRTRFADAAARLASDRRPKAERLAELAGSDVAASILSLKICDPAMGSGHFLVTLVDQLADAMLAAVADAPALADWADDATPYVSPVSARIDALRARIRATADANGWRVTADQLDDRHLVRRMILKRCVFGVDKNPMAVELAKLSLWLHSFTVGAPLSFLDHHLRCGDSLFGEWVRPAMDRLARGGMFVNSTVASAFASVAGMARIEDMADADLAEAHESADTFSGVQAATDPLRRIMDQLHGYRWVEADAEEARKEVRRLRRDITVALAARNQAAADALLARVKPLERKAGALDLWLEGAFGDPLPALDSFYGQVHDPDPARALLGYAAAVAAEERFLHWEVAFPGVWTDPTRADGGGGFDAVIGNPPWDRLKLQEVEWFAARKREIAYEPRASDRKRRIRGLREDADPLWDAYVAVGERVDQAARMAKLKPAAGGDYPLLGGGDVNLYSLFVERAQRLVRADGVVGLLVPSGIAADKGAATFFKGVSTTGRLGSLLDFENRLGPGDGFFPEVDSRFKFAAFVTGGRARTFAEAETGFFLGDTDDDALARRTFALTPETFAAVNPNTGTAPVFRTPDDARIVSGIYERVPILVDRRTDPPTQTWPVRYYTMFHMTNDAGKFRSRDELEADGWYRVAGGRLAKGNREALPLYVGRMFRQFDHRAADVTVNLDNLHNPAVSAPASDADKADPTFTLAPQFFVEETEMDVVRPWSLAFRDIARVTDTRTIIASIIPAAAFNNKAPLLLDVDAIQAALLVANLNSFVLDFVARRKIQGTNANLYIVEQLPILPPSAYDRRFGPLTAGDLVRREVLRLTYASRDMAAFARDLGHAGAPFAWDPDDRRHRRARLDALFMHLYGLDRADAGYVLDAFPLVRAADEAAHGRFLTKSLVLAYMNALAADDVGRVLVA